MKRLILILVSTILITMVGIFSSCKKEEKSEKSKQEQMREAFNQNLKSYPANFEDLIGKVIKNHNFSEKTELGKLVLPEGMDIAYVHNGDTLKDKLSEDLHCLYKEDKTVMGNGAEVIAHGRASLTNFTIKPFKFEWKKDELDPIAQKYELTITSGSDLPEHTGPAYETYAEFNDVSEIGNPTFQVLDVKKERVENDDERLAFLIRKDGELFAFRADGKEWGKR